MNQTGLEIDSPAATAGRGVATVPLPRVRQWELVDFGAEGALTTVYRARPQGAPPDLPGAYALKMLRPAWQDDPRAIALLCREVEVSRSVSHAHLVSLLAAAVNAPPRYVVMPWLSGATLAEVLSGAPRLEPRVAFWIARQVAEALEALAAAGWTHGDVKPSNIFVSPEGHATLLDLGFAQRTDRRGRAVERVIAGTCNYIAPEVLSLAWPVDVRSDLYSLGVVLFQMLTGRLLFEGKDGAEIARRHRESRAPDLARFVDNLPADAAILVREMLAKQPLRRPHSAEEVVERLVALEIANWPQDVSCELAPEKAWVDQAAAELPPPQPA